MGSGVKEHRELAEPLGAWIAARGYHLLTGGGGGVMAAVTRAFHGVPGRRGLAVGILPGEADATGYRPRPGYPNPWVELAIYTHLPLSGERGTEPMSRNHINVLSASAVIALPGGAGTRSEVELALRYRRPLIAFLGEAGHIDGLPGAIPRARTLAEVERFIVERVPPPG
jgi:uncharacterized protein (TIGR00725 family)